MKLSPSRENNNDRVIVCKAHISIGKCRMRELVVHLNADS